MLEDMDRRLNKVLNNHRSSYVDLITNKENVKLYSEKPIDSVLTKNANTADNIP